MGTNIVYNAVYTTLFKWSIHHCSKEERVYQNYKDLKNESIYATTVYTTDRTAVVTCISMNN